MKSEHYPYKVAAVYPDAATAEAAIQALVTSDLGGIRIFLLDSGTAEVDLAVVPEPRACRDTDTGATITAGAAAPATPALFISAPVVEALVVLGYGTMIGGTAGAIHGLRLRENILADMLKDMFKAGYQVIIVHAADAKTERRLHEVIQSTMAGETVYS